MSAVCTLQLAVYITYIPGELVIKGNKSGCTVAEHRQVTAGTPSRLQFQSDRSSLLSDTINVAVIRVAIVSKNDVCVP
jgi:hypothetical protein